MTSISKKIFGIIIVLWVLSFFEVGALITSYVALIPIKVFPGMELWRLITFVLAFQPFGFLMGLICFSIPAEELETFVGKRRFVLLLFAVTILTAIFDMMVYYRSIEVLSGMGNLALFVLSGYVYLFPNSELRFFFFQIKSKFLLIGFIVLLAVVAFGNQLWFFNFFSLGGYGVLLGAIYFHIRYQKYAIFLRSIRKVENFVDGNNQHEETRVYESDVQTKLYTQYQNVTKQIAVKHIHTLLSDEEIMNEILDKINEKGYENLLKEEKDFLDDYSKKI